MHRRWLARCQTARQRRRTALVCARHALTRGAAQDILIGVVTTSLALSGALRWDTWVQLVMVGSVAKTVTDVGLSYVECRRRLRAAGGPAGDVV